MKSMIRIQARSLAFSHLGRISRRNPETSVDSSITEQKDEDLREKGE
jgi:hypothetical protein